MKNQEHIQSIKLFTPLNPKCYQVDQTDWRPAGEGEIVTEPIQSN